MNDTNSNSTPEPTDAAPAREPASSAVPAAPRHVGVGEVLSHVRTPEDILAPHVVEFHGVTKTYNRGKANAVEVLTGVDLKVAPGEIVALVAPSGAGKSTLLHIAGLLDVADAGTVRINGREMVGLSDRRRTAVRRQDVGFDR